MRGDVRGKLGYIERFVRLEPDNEPLRKFYEQESDARGDGPGPGALTNTRRRVALVHDVRAYFPTSSSAFARSVESTIFVRSPAFCRLPVFTSSSCIQLSLSIGMAISGSTSRCLTTASYT